MISCGKSYLSIHVFGIYVYPELQNMISSNLKKKQQGLQCFNFKKVDTEKLEELKNLVKTSINKYSEDGYL